MRLILAKPSLTVDDNYLYSLGVLLPGLLRDLNLTDTDEDKVSCLLRGLSTIHNCGALYTASINRHEFDREDGRSLAQKAMDVRALNEKVIAQIVPPEAMPSDH